MLDNCGEIPIHTDLACTGPQVTPRQPGLISAVHQRPSREAGVSTSAAYDADIPSTSGRSPSQSPQPIWTSGGRVSSDTAKRVWREVDPVRRQSMTWREYEADTGGSTKASPVK